MAEEATGTATSLGIPKFSTSVDKPSGVGSNNQMDAIDTLIIAANKTPVKKAGVTTGTRRGINFIEGSNVTITLADDSTNDEVDVTLAASGLSLTGHTHVLSSITDAGTSASKNIPSTGDASTAQVVYGTDTRLTNTRTPASHTHPLSEITGDGTAAALDVPATGNASTAQVVFGTDTRLSDARTPSAHTSSHASGGSDALSGNLDATARISVSKAGSVVGARRRLNLIEGSNVTLTVADDSGSEEVDITIAASVTGATIAIQRNDVSIGSRGILNFIQGTGTTLTVADDSAGGEVDITIASTGVSMGLLIALGG